MKSRFVIIFLILLAATESFAQQRDVTSFGIELGYGTRTQATSGVLARGFYAAGFGGVEMEIGVLITTIADDAFGFDIKTRIPIDAGRKKTALLASFGVGALVWSNTVSIGVPIGLHYQVAASQAIILEPSLNITPSYTLTADDKNFVLFDLRLGIRF